MNTFALVITLATLAFTMFFLASSLIRGDLVAILIVVILAASGVLTPAEALSGFSSNAVVIIACMFIVGKAIIHTGIAQHVGEAIIKRGGSNEKVLLVLLMSATAIVGAFMSSTATVAIFIPIAVTVAEKTGLNHKRLLMPLAVAALISGMMSLVATTPNLVVNDVLRSQGMSFGFFSITPFGVLCLALGIAFMALCGQNMLAPSGSAPKRTKDPGIDDLLRYYSIDSSEYLFRVPPTSNLVGMSVAQVGLANQHHVILVGIKSLRFDGRHNVSAARPESIVQAEDTLMLVGKKSEVSRFGEQFALQPVAARHSVRKSFFRVVGMAELMLSPDSVLIGKSLRESGFQSQFHSMVLALRRNGETIVDDLGDLKLKVGDVLLACGGWNDIVRLGKHRDQYILLTLPDEYRDFIPAANKERLTLAVLATMIPLMVFNILPPVTAILAASAALVLLRCVPLSSIYEVVDWQTIIMIAGILPLALAMQKTGLIGAVSTFFEAHLAGAGPITVLSALFVVTALLGLFITNTAVAVLMAPMAIDVAQRLSMPPEACAMVVAVACSAAFMSPLGSPVNMLVREPGGYCFGDFIKVGVPMLLLCLGATLLLCWLLYV